MKRRISLKTAVFPPTAGCALKEVTIISLIQIIRVVFRVYYMLILLRVVFSWVRIGDNFVNRFVYDTTEPLLGRIRRLIPPRPSFPLDFSPIIAFIVLQLLEWLLIRLLFMI